MAGEPMKPATNLLAGLLYSSSGSPDLLHHAVLHDDDAVAERHRLDLVVRDVDRRGAQPLVQLLELDPHLHAQLGVEVGQRLVEQEHLRVAHDRAAQRDALALAAGELARLALEQFADAEDLGRLVDALARSRAWRTCASCRPKAMLSNTLMCG